MLTGGSSILNITTIIITLVILVFFASTFRFTLKEGTDERGNKIIAGAGMTALITFFFSFSVVFLIRQFRSITGSEYDIILILIVDVVLLAYSIMVMVLRRVY